MRKIQFLFASLFLYNFTINHLPVKAQITPDSTLGNESSQVNPNVLIKGSNADQINGGATRGSNLFHSFSEFNISDGQRVYFANPSGVLNILTRVTGNNSSSIFGTLGVDGNANLFLMNPNGILFGKNASLDVQGSFIGTTANGLKFGNQGVFSATNPEAPALLTINPNALTFSQQESGAITSQSQAPAGVSPNGNNTRGLRVPDGKSLLLVGGNVSVDDSGLRAYDGRIEVTGLAAPGDIGLNMTGDILSLNIPKDVTLADVFLSNDTGISVLGTFGGNIAINARNIDINSSTLFAGIAIGKVSPTTQAGDITLNATENITLGGNFSAIDNQVYENAIGNGGNIRISANSLTLKDDASLSTYTFGNGNGGSVFLQVNDAVTLENSTIFSTVEAGAVGNGGDINIQAGSLTLTDSAQLLTTIRPARNTLRAGKGNGGDININVRGAVTFANPTPGLINGIGAEVGKGADGNGGNVTINAASVDITGGSEIQTSTRGKGNAGNITINARDSIRFDGKGETGSFSRAIAAVQEGAEGNAGNINITTDTLKLTNGAFLSGSTLGQGNAANITINARDISFDSISRASSDVFKTGRGNGGEIRITTNSLSLTNGGEISSDVLGEGNAGNIFIDAKDSVKVDGVLVDAGKLEGSNLDFDAWSNISSDLLGESIGKAGNIQITTPSLSLTNAGQISSTSSGQGDAGNITINAPNNVIISGFAGRFNTNSQVSSYVIRNAVGNSGEIRIKTGNLTVNNGGAIGTNNGGIGNGGNIFIDATDTITFDGIGGNGQGSQAVSFATNGNAGNIQIKTGSLFLTNGGVLSSTLSGRGNAGNIVINARDTVKIDGIIQDGTDADASTLTSALLSGEGKGGDIEIITGSLFVTNGGVISANTSGRGNAGNITINARDTVTFDGGVNGLFTTAGNATLEESVGNGGDIRINARALSLKNGGSLAAFSSGSGNAGNIFIDTLDSINIDGSNGNSIPSQATAFAIGSGNGGNIQLKTGTLTLTDGGQLTTYARRNAGNIDINARDAVFIDGISGDTQSGAFTSLLPGGVGKGGDIQLTTNSLTVQNRGQLATITFGQGDAGNILINTFGDITLKNGSTINAATVGQGNAGNVTVNAGGKIFLEGTTVDGLKFDTGIFTIVASDSGFTGQGKGGNINVTSRDLSLNGATISASNLVDGNGGDININTGNIRLDNKSAIASVTNSGNGGNFNLNVKDYILLRNNSRIFTTAGFDNKSSGDGGNITINTPFIVAVPKENSDISANAFSGTGGNINIQTQNLFGIEARPKPTNQSDITASSELGVQGEVSIRKPDVDSNRVLIQSPQVFKDKSDELDQLCGRGKKPLGRFIATGKQGTLPTNPVINPMQGGVDFSELATLDESNTTNRVNQVPDSLTVQNPSPNRIVEAQALVRGADGTLHLVAEAPNVIPNSRPATSACANVRR
ncbi:beta strand repeat-containing protein [Calothrix sp. PCC 6303]|uniref:beta strand repeat-containing protein n=1 Tax=Calothrix sp. PCC 6303 TaxID=1170562 RepID=UPI0002A00184|nr:filamentous hemagglutinin N-terminal domain-containing protein [Calothrix sp. PCC 6303]AFZ00687.1 filamentous hemagglutinin family outer membrane protein [Calothrix sp. PCC 6303]